MYKIPLMFQLKYFVQHKIPLFTIPLIIMVHLQLLLLLVAYHIALHLALTVTINGQQWPDLVLEMCKLYMCEMVKIHKRTYHIHVNEAKIFVHTLNFCTSNDSTVIKWF